jgi:hypothetical protein
MCTSIVVTIVITIVIEVVSGVILLLIKERIESNKQK